MRLNVNPNRMELLKLRRRIAIARRGHKLLKDKQDELMRMFMKRIDLLKSMRTETEGLLQKATGKYIMLKALVGSEKMQALLQLTFSYDFKQEWQTLMNVRLPKFELHITREEGLVDYFETPYAFDDLKATYKELMTKLMELAQEEQAIRLLAEEIGKTRRRVNALEHILIPNLLETMRYITMKLTENERGTVVRLMKIKEIVRNK